MGTGEEDDPIPDDLEPDDVEPDDVEADNGSDDLFGDLVGDLPDRVPDEEAPAEEPGRGRPGRWVPRWPEHWTHGAITLAILAALVAVTGIVFTSDYLAERADDVVLGKPADSDVPYTPGATTGSTDATPTGTLTGSEPPVSDPATGSAPPTTAVPPPAPESVIGETCVPDGVPTEISVVSFNIKSSRGPAGVQIDLLAQTLAAWEPDVVLLQEVDKLRPISGRLDMPAYLGEKLGYYSTFGANVLRPGNSQYGTAILSRFPITSSENTLLPHPANTQQRGLLHAVIDVDGVALSAYVTHLEHTSADARMQQVTAIRDLLAADQGPLVLGGDFNATPSTPVMALARSFVSDTWTAAGDGGSGLTAPNSAPRARIDYLLHRGAVEPLSMQVLTPPLSDHRALEARYAVGTVSEICVPVFG